MKLLSVIDKNLAIGYQNSLLFHLPSDLAHFKKHTLGKWVVMGQNTLLSMPKGKPLPGRSTLVLNIDAPSGKICDLEGGYAAYSFQSLSDFWEFVETKQIRSELVVAGGASIYRLLLDSCDELVLTEVQAEAEKADTYFPEFRDKFVLENSEGPFADGSLVYRINTYKKRQGA